MANEVRVRSALRNFISSMQTHDAEVSEELAKDALEMVEEVSDALCEDQEADVLEVTKDEEPKAENVEKLVADGVMKALKELGLYKDPAMKALDELEAECNGEEEKKADDESSVVVEDEGNEEEVTVDPKDMKDAKILLRLMKPQIATIKDSKKRKEASDALARLLKMQTGMQKMSNKQYGDIMDIAKKSKDSKLSAVDSDIDYGMQLAKRFNPHYKEEN